MNATTDSKTRVMLNWREGNLAIAKTLAFRFFWDGTRSETGVWNGVSRMLPDVVREVTGEEGVTLSKLCKTTRAETGLELTPNKLLQRADKMDRYGETNVACFGDVTRAYDKLKKAAA